MAQESMSSVKIDALSVALEEGGAALHAVLDAMPELAWTASPSGEPEFFNRRWVEYTGEANERVIHPEDAVQTHARWSDAVLTGKPFETEYRLQRADDGAYPGFWRARFRCAINRVRCECGSVPRRISMHKNAPMKICISSWMHRPRSFPRNRWTKYAIISRSSRHSGLPIGASSCCAMRADGTP